MLVEADHGGDDLSGGLLAVEEEVHVAAVGAFLEGEGPVAAVVAAVILVGVPVVFFAGGEQHRCSYRQHGDKAELQYFFIQFIFLTI